MGTAATGTLAVSRSGGAVDPDADLPGAGGHEPEGAGEEGGVGGGLLHRVGGGWVLRGFAGEGEGGDVDGADGGAGGADLDGGDAGDDVRRADGGEELVAAGGDLLEDVLVADVGVSDGGRKQEREQGEQEAVLRRRRLFCDLGDER